MDFGQQRAAVTGAEAGIGKACTWALGQARPASAIAAGMIPTALTRSARDDQAERVREQAAIPWSRAGRAKEVAELVLYPRSPATCPPGCPPGWPEARRATSTAVTVGGGLAEAVLLGAGA
jgi:glucose 1-dehydrogenase